MKPLYSAGDIALVRFGAKQSQLARVLEVKGMLVQVEKWMANSARWGKPAWVPERKMLGPAPADDPRREAALAGLVDGAVRHAAGAMRAVSGEDPVWLAAMNAPPETEAIPDEERAAVAESKAEVAELRALAKPGPGRSLLEKLIGGRRP